MMYANSFGEVGGQWWGLPFWGGFALLMVLAIVWSLVWKGLGLWKAARKGDKWWFIAMLIINTLGILEILYIYLFSRKDVMDKISKPIESVKEESPKEEHHHQS